MDYVLKIGSIRNYANMSLYIFSNIYNISILPLKMTGKSKVTNTHSHVYYPIRPKIPQQHYRGNGYNNTHS
jgi:hypothetical protein